MKPPTPILSGILAITGAFSLLGAVAMVLLTKKTEGGVTALLLLQAGAMALSAMIQFGIGQAVTYLARSAYYAEQSARTLLLMHHASVQRGE